uniref:RING-type domain-containing protein n=1 Tax=Oryza glumipatula TaxID=40148 RepID=A0A0D9YNL0_9ORYZ
MAGLAGDDSSFFGDDGDGDGDGDEFCYGPFDVEDLCYGASDVDDDWEEFCDGPFGGGDGPFGGGGVEEFCVSGFSVRDLSDASSSGARETGDPHDDDPLPQTLARSLDSDGDLSATLHQIVSAMRLSEDEEEEEEEEEEELLVLGHGHGVGIGGGGDVDGFMVSAFDLDTAMAIGGILEDIHEVMGADEVREEVVVEEEEAGNGGGIMPNGFEFGPPPRAISGTAAGFRMMVDADDTDSDDFQFVEVLGGGQVREAGAGMSMRPSRASQLVVESLPEATLSEEEASRGCAVCKDCFASGQIVALLPCKHYFHGDCIWPWLAIRTTCPVCRHQVRTEDDDYEQRMARRVIVLAAVEHQGAPAQGCGDSATMGAEGASECVVENGPEKTSS